MALPDIENRDFWRGYLDGMRDTINKMSLEMAELGYYENLDTTAVYEVMVRLGQQHDHLADKWDLNDDTP